MDDLSMSHGTQMVFPMEIGDQDYSVSSMENQWVTMGQHEPFFNRYPLVTNSLLLKILQVLNAGNGWEWGLLGLLLIVIMGHSLIPY